MLLDLKNDIKVTQLIAPVGRAAGTVNGTALALTDYGSVVIVFGFGGLTGGTAAIKLQESVDGTNNWTDIASSRLTNTLGAAVADTPQIVGLTEVGALAAAYIRPVITITGGTALEACAFAIQSNPKITPVGDDGSVYIA